MQHTSQFWMTGTLILRDGLFILAAVAALQALAIAIRADCPSTQALRLFGSSLSATILSTGAPWLVRHFLG